MINFLVQLKDLAQLILPFLLIWFFGKQMYGVSFMRAMKWWFANFRDVEFLGLFLVGLFFSVFGFFATLNHLSQTVVLKYFGDYHKMIYLGNPDEHSSEYLKIVDGADRYFTVPEHDGNYNFTINNAYKEVLFKREAGTNRIGSRAQGFSMFSVLLSIVLLLIMLFPLVICLHVFFYLPSVEVADSYLYAEAVSKSFDSHFLAPYNLTRKLLGIAFFGALVFVMVLTHFKPAMIFGERQYELPYKPGDKVVVTPLALNKVYVSRSTSNGSYREEDSGFRVVVLKISEGLPYPIWVSTEFDARKNISMEKALWQKIESGGSVDVNLNADFAVDIDLVSLGLE